MSIPALSSYTVLDISINDLFLFSFFFDIAILFIYEMGCVFRRNDDYSLTIKARSINQDKNDFKL